MCSLEHCRSGEGSGGDVKNFFKKFFLGELRGEGK